MVYILMSDLGYDGKEFLGTFSSLEKAKNSIHIKEFFDEHSSRECKWVECGNRHSASREYGESIVIIVSEVE